MPTLPDLMLSRKTATGAEWGEHNIMQHAPIQCRCEAAARCPNPQRYLQQSQTRLQPAMPTHVSGSAAPGSTNSLHKLPTLTCGGWVVLEGVDGLGPLLEGHAA
jgi:hypothetical protein